jgi:tRNA 2-thiouridine synthesizing protein A
MTTRDAARTLDAGPLGCGDLILLIFQTMKTLAPGETLRVLAHDDGADADIPAWCRSTGNRLVDVDTRARPKVFVIQKT